jgi:hypothetical protein
MIPDPSQENRILAILRERGGWVSAVELSGISLQYCARIAGLRKRGFAIENRLQVSESGGRRGFYRLKPLPEMPRTAPNVSRETQRRPTLFSQNALMTTWRDPEEQR